MRSPTVVALTLVVLSAGCDLAPTEVAAPRGAPRQDAFALGNAALQQSATGHVQVSLEQFGIPFERYSFSAVRHAGGAVSGRFVVYTEFSEATILQGDVTCLTILPDGKTARVGGVVTQSNVDRIVPGMEAAWFVRDNGEGRHAVGRQRSALRVSHRSRPRTTALRQWASRCHELSVRE